MTVKIDTDAEINSVRLKESAAPSTPASGYGQLYEKTDGQLYFKNDAGTERGLRGFTLLHNETLAAPGTFSITGIAQNYDHLELVCSLKANAGVPGAEYFLSFNNDTTQANYNTARHIAGLSATIGQHSLATGTTRACMVGPGESDAASIYGKVHALVPYYTNALSIKGALVKSIDVRVISTTYFLNDAIMVWNSPSPINRVDISVNNANVDFSSGSSVQLFAY